MIPSPNALLQNAFNRQQEKNHKFSLRMLAQLSGLSPAYISQVLNGKKIPTIKALNLMIKHLSIDNNHRERMLLAQLYHASKKVDDKEFIAEIYRKLTKS